MHRPDILPLIRAKRDGQALSREDIEGLIAHLGTYPDYQVAAWLMACTCRGLSLDETVALTRAMAHSGEVLDLSDVPGPRVDKHSTGGVGDKVTLVLAPLVAAAGATVAKLSGRGLGHTGGTIDKLESLGSFRTAVEPEHFKAQLRRLRVAVAGQSRGMAPADGRLYALRDVTATIECPGLICASILSKKIAAGADIILLDVKTGRGAFMETEAEAEALAGMLREVGERLGRRVICVVSAMGQPLGRNVGNALEVAEAIETLSGGGPADLRELCLELGAQLCVAGGLDPDAVTARTRLAGLLDDGTAKARFRELVAAQGGDITLVDEPENLPSAPLSTHVVARTAGTVLDLDARCIGDAVVALGAGRRTKEDVLDLGAGVRLLAKVGDAVLAGQPLAEVRASDPERLEAGRHAVEQAYKTGEGPASPPPLIHAIFGGIPG
ncbi:MAG: thymidine phosphorylase [Candidatus Sericytochromatia bacterium]|nr:thymidine phosphorylase [Candidatus Sericytochromatia bacterium]